MSVTEKVNVIITGKDKSKGAFKSVIKGAGMLTAAISAMVIAIGVKAVKAGAKFEKSMSNISTLVDTSTESMKEMGDEVKALAKKMPIAMEDLTESLYAVRSAGIDAGSAMGVLEDAGKLATAGLGTTAEATDLVTSAINAFGIDAKESNRVGNDFFLAVKKGKTTVSELAQGFGQVAPLANEMNISLEDLLSVTSAMTTSGMKASIAYTSVKAALSNMIKPTAEMSGALETLGWNVDDVKENMGEEGLVSTLKALAESVDYDTETMAKMFGSVEGLNGVLMLLNETGEMSDEIFKSMQNELGAMDEAYIKQKETVDALWQTLKNNLEVVYINLADKILPPLVEAVKSLTSALSDWDSFVNGMKAGIKDFMDLIDEKTSLVTVLTTAWDELVLVFNQHLKPALDELWKQLEPLKPFLKVLAKLFGGVLLGAIIVLAKILEYSLIVLIVGLTNALKSLNGFIDLVKKGWDSWTTSLSKVVTWVDNLIASIKKLNVVQGAVNAVKGWLGFQSGGMVNAPLGQAVPAMVHGGERIVPAGRQMARSGAGGGVVVNINGGTYLSEDVALEMGNMIIDRLKLQLRI